MMTSHAQSTLSRAAHWQTQQPSHDGTEHIICYGMMVSIHRLYSTLKISTCIFSQTLLSAQQGSRLEETQALPFNNAHVYLQSNVKTFRVIHAPAGDNDTHAHAVVYTHQATHTLAGDSTCNDTQHSGVYIPSRPSIGRILYFQQYQHVSAANGNTFIHALNSTFEILHWLERTTVIPKRPFPEKRLFINGFYPEAPQSHL
jgi:hypothetical protein